jgi:hypothetical protein
MAVIVMAAGDRLTVAGTAQSVVDALSKARREELCPFEGDHGTVHVSPTHVSYVEEDREPAS